MQRRPASRSSPAAPRSAGRWRAEAVRDFAIAAGRLQLVRRVAHAPDPVDVTIAVARGVPVDAEAAADEAVLAIEHLSKLYGPYPWPGFTIAYGADLESEGIEYPTLVFEGPDRSGLITAHETAHQWFYSLVGNNQARDPWLDEGLASWAGAETSNDMAIFATAPIPDVGRRSPGSADDLLVEASRRLLGRRLRPGRAGAPVAGIEPADRVRASPLRRPQRLPDRHRRGRALGVLERLSGCPLDSLPATACPDRGVAHRARPGAGCVRSDIVGNPGRT